MSKYDVLELNLHFSGEGCLVAASRRVWVGMVRRPLVVRRDYLEGMGIGTPPQAVLRALADRYDQVPVQAQGEPDPSS